MLKFLVIKIIFVVTRQSIIMNYRVGNGFDVHRLAEGRRLVLGGVDIPHDVGCVAHSDGDALIHALCDALLGAMALRDIGYWFPDNDDAFKDIDSRILLRKVHDLMLEGGWKLENADCTLILQAPKVAPYVETMRKNLADDLCCEISQVMVKATTSEHLGFTGRKEGVAASATVLISRENG